MYSLEGKVGGEFLLEDVIFKGLFIFFFRSENRIVLCGIDECFEWFKEVVGLKRGVLALFMKRFL